MLVIACFGRHIVSSGDSFTFLPKLFVWFEICSPASDRRPKTHGCSTSTVACVISRPTVFVGGANTREQGGLQPGRTWSGPPLPARTVIYSNHGLKPGMPYHNSTSRAVGRSTVRENPMSPVVRSAWSVILSVVLHPFVHSLSSPSRGLEATTSPLARAQMCIWAAARDVPNGCVQEII